MAILEYVEQTKIETCATKFQCDICKSVFELKDELSIKYNSDVKSQMAVLEYYSENRHKNNVHCCSTECLSKAIKEVPYEAKISIPVSGFYRK